MSKKPTSNAKVTELPDQTAGEHGLTARQLKILQVIKASMDDQGFPPSMRAIAAAAGLSSPASVKYQLEILEEKGFITPHPTRGGVLEVLMPGEKSEIEVEATSRFHSLAVSQPVAQSPLNKMSNQHLHFLKRLWARATFICCRSSANQ
jgi:repressor LexA